jgi:hypothetical protein
MNENVDYKLDIDKMWGKKIARFLWKCAGGDEQIMKYASYYDHMKMMGIGGVVLATSVLATIAMGFAIQTIFGSWYATIPIALVWGLIIFNLDRFIVSVGKGDGEEKIGGWEFISAFPRLVMAVFIGITISAPLETEIFDKEIDREWENAKMDMSIKRRYEVEQEFLNTGEYRSTTDKIKKDSIVLSISEARKKEFDLKIELLNTSGLNGEVCTEGATCPTERHQTLYKLAADANIEYTKDLRRLDSLKKVLASFEDRRVAMLNAAADSIKALKPGFLDKIMMIERLSSEGKLVEVYDPTTGKIKMENGKPVVKEIYGNAWWPINLVRWLFILLEVAPVLLKMFMVKSAYDYMQENVTQILIAKQGIYYEPIKDENGKLIWTGTNYNPERIIEVIKHQNELEKRNAKEAITVFADEEMKKIQDDPSQFFDDNGKKKPE